VIALTQDRAVYAWGSNAAGQLGVGHLKPVDAPASVVIAQRVDAVAAGASHALALASDGTVLAWGSNNHGQLGLGHPAPAYATTPIAVDLPERAQAVGAGMYFSVALSNSGRVYAWGWNHHGQVGVPGEDDRRRPTLVDGIAGVRAIAVGQAHVAALAADGLYGWGSNAAGQLGDAAKEQRRPHQLLATREPRVHG
jgi:alpha-tubulin suppressor-like RCC1 family protein